MLSPCNICQVTHTFPLSLFITLDAFCFSYLLFVRFLMKNCLEKIFFLYRYLHFFFLPREIMGEISCLLVLCKTVIALIQNGFRVMLI